MAFVDKSHLELLGWINNRIKTASGDRHKMSGKFYTLVFYGNITDQAAFEAYVELAAPAVLDAGAQYLVRGEPVATYEKGQQARVTVLEWDTLEQAHALYSHPGYVAALEKLGGTVDRDIRILPAFDPNALNK